METGAQSQYDDRQSLTLAAEETKNSEIETAFSSAAIDGKVRLEELPSILRTEGIVDSDEVIFETLKALRGDGKADEPFVTLEEVLVVFQQMEASSNRRSTSAPLNPLPESQSAVAKKEAHESCCGWLKCLHRKKKSEGSKMKPTTRLVLIVAAITLTIAVTVAGVAIGLAWNSSYQVQKEVLKTEVTMVSNAVESFSVKQAYSIASSSQFITATIFADMVNGVGLETSLAVASLMQTRVVNMASTIVDQLLTYSSQDIALNLARGFAGMSSELCDAGLATSLVDLINKINTNRLSAAEEILLAKLGTDGSSVQFMTTFRKCADGSCKTNLGTDNFMKTCLTGTYGGKFILDYTGTTVVAGAYPVNCSAMGVTMCVTYQMDVELRRTQYRSQITDVINKLNPKLDSVEILMFPDNSSGVPLTTYKNTALCSGGQCGTDKAALEAMDPSVVGLATTSGTSYYGATVISAGAFLPVTNCYFVMEIDLGVIKGNVITSLGTFGTLINNKLNGTQEILLAQRQVVNNTASFQYVVAPKMTQQCEPNCGDVPGANQSMSLAAVSCVNGVGTFTDYRAQQVLAAFMCVPALSIGLVFKMDMNELHQNSISQLATYVNSQNQQDSSTFELMVGRASSYPGKVTILSDLKESGKKCTTGCEVDKALAGSMVSALNDGTGTVEDEKDYDGVHVMSSYTYSSELAIGIVLKRSVSEINAPLVVQLLILLGTAIGIALIGVVVEFTSARMMLKTIEDTWETARMIMQKQKESFEQLVSAMYPKFVTERLLEGDSQIVMELSESTIFFSDICNFTAMSNQLSADELVQWIGYTFRVMDHVAEFHRIYKVKSIGDAYFALAGLPGMVAEGQQDEHTLRTVIFAIQCVQLFSGRYRHPAAADFLENIANKNVLLKLANKDKKKSDKKSEGRSTTNKSHKSSEVSGHTSTTSGDCIDGAKNSKCAMRYGVCCGPVTVGVMQGKCPAFDVWGKTVNKASRFEASGRPGNVHVSEDVYRAVVNHPKCLIRWEKGHGVYAKGFGNVQGYFMKTTDLLPPKELLLEIGVEPSLGRFHFEAEYEHSSGHRRPSEVKQVTVSDESAKSMVLVDAEAEV